MTVKLSNMSPEDRGRTVRWAKERIESGHQSPARDAAVMLLDLVQACLEVSQSAIDDAWLRELCSAALYGPPLAFEIRESQP